MLGRRRSFRLACSSCNAIHVSSCILHSSLRSKLRPWSSSDHRSLGFGFQTWTQTKSRTSSRQTHVRWWEILQAQLNLNQAGCQVSYLQSSLQLQARVQRKRAKRKLAGTTKLSIGNSFTTDSTSIRWLGLARNSGTMGLESPLEMCGMAVSTSVPKIHLSANFTSTCPTYFSCIPCLLIATMDRKKRWCGSWIRSGIHQSWQEEDKSLVLALKSFQNRPSTDLPSGLFPLSTGSRSSVHAKKARESMHLLTMWSCSAWGDRVSQWWRTVRVSSQPCRATCTIFLQQNFFRNEAPKIQTQNLELPYLLLLVDKEIKSARWQVKCRAWRWFVPG